MKFEYSIIMVRGRADNTKIGYFIAPPSSTEDLVSIVSLDVNDAYVYADVWKASDEYAYLKPSKYYEFSVKVGVVDLEPYIRKAQGI